MSTKPYTIPQLRENLMLISANLERTPSLSDREWCRWVLRDIVRRGVTVEDAEPVTTLEIDPTDSHEWGCDCAACKAYWEPAP